MLPMPAAIGSISSGLAFDMKAATSAAIDVAATAPDSRVRCKVVQLCRDHSAKRPPGGELLSADCETADLDGSAMPVSITRVYHTFDQKFSEVSDSDLGVLDRASLGGLVDVVILITSGQAIFGLDQVSLRGLPLDRTQHTSKMVVRGTLARATSVDGKFANEQGDWSAASFNKPLVINGGNDSNVVALDGVVFNPARLDSDRHDDSLGENVRFLDFGGEGYVHVAEDCVWSLSLITRVGGLNCLAFTRPVRDVPTLRFRIVQDILR